MRAPTDGRDHIELSGRSDLLIEGSEARLEPRSYTLRARGPGGDLLARRPGFAFDLSKTITRLRDVVTIMGTSTDGSQVIASTTKSGANILLQLSARPGAPAYSHDFKDAQCVF